MLNKDKIIIVADFFVDDFFGGAELTTEALLQQGPIDVIRIKALELTYDHIREHKDKLWIFGNFTRMKYTLLPDIMRELKYMVIEYDYKFCIYRSMELHQIQEGRPCDCHQYYGKKIANFLKNSAHIWWMSEKQKKIYEERFITLREANGTVLSSIFSKADLQKLKELRDQNIDRKGWAVVGHGSWIKGVEDSKKYCQENALPAKVLPKMKHDELLSELAKAEGFVFMPKGGDSCPRLVIEAKLAGCKLAINEHVQHKDEPWFQGAPDHIEQYLIERPNVFWSAVFETINQTDEGDSRCQLNTSTKIQ